MKKRTRYFLCLALTLLLCSTGLFGCGKTTKEKDADVKTSTDTAEEQTDTKSEETKSEPTVIRYGTHYVKGLDPNYVDEVTGEYTMGEAERQAALAALDAVKKELNVEFEFVQYSGDTRNDLMTSVLAGDPICDLATIWGGAEGTILAQNVLQELDGYEDLFADDNYSWMWVDKLYGHNYFLSFTERFYQRWPLIFNISLIDKVDSLKDKDGNTILPTDLFLSGEWTWSTFKDYLSKLNAYYSNVEAEEGSVYDTVQAYETDHRFAGLSAVYANGGSIYGSEGIQVNSDKTKEGLDYIQNLMSEKLLVDPGVYDDGFTPQWTTAANDFGRSSTVFTDCPDWMIAGQTSLVAEDGQSVGMVPWPRPDAVSKDDASYKQVITLGDSVGVLKGVDKEKTELALKAYRLYWSTYYTVYGGVDNIADYKEQTIATQAAALGLDIYNETYGNDILECMKYITNNLSNDYADMLDLRVIWDGILGKSLYGLEGMSSYSVAIEANINLFDKAISNMESILASDEVRDNRAPDFTKQTIVVKKGTKSDDIDFTQFFTATDAVDGTLDLAKAKFEINESVDFSKPGSYADGVKIILSDASGNEGNASTLVVVYDPSNKKAPTIKPVDTLPTIAVDTDASTIAWAGTYIASAVDTDGIDILANLTADISTLDTTTPGDYDVVITATDYAGNTSDVTIKVTVAEAEE
jgi:hypothetical protein